MIISDDFEISQDFHLTFTRPYKYFLHIYMKQCLSVKYISLHLTGLPNPTKISANLFKRHMGHFSTHTNGPVKVSMNNKAFLLRNVSYNRKASNLKHTLFTLYTKLKENTYVAGDSGIFVRWEKDFFDTDMSQKILEGCSHLCKTIINEI